MKKHILAVGIFIFTFLVYHIGFGCNVFPVDEATNTLQAPGWYPVVGIVLSVGVAVLLSRKKRISTGDKIGKNPSMAPKAHKPALNMGVYFSNDDELLDPSIEIVLETGMASVSLLQRRLNLGYSRSARLIDMMEEIGLIGPFVGSEPRKIYLTKRQWEEALEAPYKPSEKQMAKKDLDAIRSLESIFECGLQSVYRNMLKAEDGEKKYNEIVNKIQKMDLSLAEQIRFEQLCNEYREKFKIENPFIAIDAMDGHQFEAWCAKLLEMIGFQKVEVTQGSGDQGVDILAQKDGIRYAIQCKCYSIDLGNTPIQEVNTGKMIYHCQIGVVMTNRRFTSGGKQAAEATETLLWDRDWIENQLKQIDKIETAT